MRIYSFLIKLHKLFCLLFPSFFSLLDHSYFNYHLRILLNMMQHGAVYKLAFGPKAFVVVSDPIVARHILRENAFSYDKV